MPQINIVCMVHQVMITQSLNLRVESVSIALEEEILILVNITINIG